MTTTPTTPTPPTTPDPLPWTDRATFCAALAAFVASPTACNAQRAWLAPRRERAVDLLAALEPGAHDELFHARLFDRGETSAVRAAAASALRARSYALRPRELCALLAEVLAGGEVPPMYLHELLALVCTDAHARAVYELLDARAALDRASALVELLGGGDAMEPAARELRERLYARWLVEDRARLDEADGDEAPLAGLNQQIAAGTVDRPATREIVLAAWRGAPPVRRAILCDLVGQTSALVAALDATELARLAEAFVLPPRALREHFGVAGLRERICARVAAACATRRSEAARDDVERAAGRAVHALYALPDAHAVAVALLARHGHDVPPVVQDDGGATRTSMVRMLTELLWRRDRAQTSELALRCARRGECSELVVWVLERVFHAPTDADDPLLEWALLHGSESLAWPARAAAALASSGVAGSRAWRSVVSALRASDDVRCRLWAAVADARRGALAGREYLAALASSSASPSERRVAVRTLAAINPRAHADALAGAVDRALLDGEACWWIGEHDVAQALGAVAQTSRLAYWALRAPGVEPARTLVALLAARVLPNA